MCSLFKTQTTVIISNQPIMSVDTSKMSILINCNSTLFIQKPMDYQVLNTKEMTFFYFEFSFVTPQITTL